MFNLLLFLLLVTSFSYSPRNFTHGHRELGHTDSIFQDFFSVEKQIKAVLVDMDYKLSYSLVNT